MRLRRVFTLFAVAVVCSTPAASVAAGGQIGLTEARELWAVRTLSHHVDLALLSPTTLISSQNQLDFVNEALVAIWEATEVSFGGLRPATSWEEAGSRQQRLDTLRGRLEGIADQLCEQLETWHRGGSPRP